MDSEAIKNIIAIVAAILGLGLVVAVTTMVVINVNKKKSKKSVKLHQGGITVNDINNTATIDQSDKNG